MGIYSVVKEVTNQDISKYKHIDTSPDTINKYKKQYPRLSHVRCNDENKGIILDDNGTFVAVIQWDVNTEYVVALEVSPKYRNKQIAQYLLDIAVSKGITKLSVNKSNKSAISLYTKMNYKVKKEDDTMIYMVKGDVNESFISESVIFDEKDLYIHFDSWKKEKGKNILYITGLSGSGKSTLAEQLESKHNAEMFELDGLEGNYDSSKSNFLKKYKDLNPKLAQQIESRDFLKLPDEEKLHIYEKFFSWLVNEMYKTPDKLYIVEGMVIYSMKPEVIKSHPTIIKGSSVLTSTIRRIKRGNGKIDLNILYAEIVKTKSKRIINAYKDDKHLSKFKKAVNENGTLIIEAASSDRKYKCPFCEFRANREDLVSHVDDTHEDMLSEEFPAPRAVFNSINKKEHGSCIICHQETKWNNETWRYERLCEMPACEKKYIELVRGRVANVHGKWNLLEDPEQQKKMLANRKISGTYKFADGGVRSYCGTYERKLLEFYDQVLHADSKDVITPGPTIQYEYNGKTLNWITDVYYVPANLVHDVKDGGDNPNNRQMDDYRAKQVAKEDAIAKLDQYNYIRLTDNNFSQLFLVLADIKYQMTDDDKPNKEFIIRIHESMLLESKKNKSRKLFHLSEKKLDGVTLQVGIPDNFLTKNGYEENTTKRVCFAPSIDKSLMGMSKNLKGVELYVHEPVSYNIKTKKPSVTEVPDSKITGEIWALEPVKVKCIGKIRVSKDTRESGISYNYGNKTAELYKWNWEWVEKYNVVKEDAATGAALPNQNNQSDNAYIVPYMVDNSFNVALSTDKYYSNMYTIQDGKIKKGSIKDLYECSYGIYEYTGDDFKAIYENILDDYQNEIDVDKYYFYEKLTGKTLMTPDQLQFDEKLEECADAYLESVIRTQISDATIVHQANKQTHSNLYLEMVNDLDIATKTKLAINLNTTILQDIDGYFLYNNKTDRRTASYDTISAIPYINIFIDKLAE